MRKHWMMASTILLSSCAAVRTASLGATIILKPQITSGAYATKTVVSPYTQASINHLNLKLFTVDTSEHDQGIQQTLLNAQLGNPVIFSNLKTNTTYRIKAYAYYTSDESQLISSTDASSSTDVIITNDDRPTLANLKVKLIDQSFSGQATSSLVINSGGYSPIGSESLDIPRVVSTLAGGAGGTAPGYADGLGTAARFNFPFGVAPDGSGNVYVADRNNNRIRKINACGMVSTLAGSSGGYADGTGAAAQFNTPYGVAVDGGGNVYVGDRYNNLIRKITSSGVVSTFAGGGGATIAGYADGTGTAAKFYFPENIAVDGSGNVYVADTFNNLIRKITSGGVVSTLAGGAGGTISGNVNGIGTAATFYLPEGVTIDGNGNVFVGDTSNHRIRKITSGGMVSTLAGSSVGYTDGTGTSAKFSGPCGVAVDGNGNVYTAEWTNMLIRKITSDGVVSTIGNTSAGGYVDGTGTAAKFSNSFGVAVDSFGNVYVGNANNNLIRKIQ